MYVIRKDHDAREWDQPHLSRTAHTAHTNHVQYAYQRQIQIFKAIAPRAHPARYRGFSHDHDSRCLHESPSLLLLHFACYGDRARTTLQGGTHGGAKSA